jgi:copper transport protein
MAVPATALAHANLVRTIPSDGAVLTNGPDRIVVVFDDAVRVAPGNEAVRNEGGSILAGSPRVRGDNLELPLKPRLGTGEFSVRWSVFTDDGHEEQGVLAFAVGSGPPPQSVLTAGNEVSVFGVVMRWLLFIGLLSAAGLALFDLLIWRQVAQAWLPMGWIASALVVASLTATALLFESGAPLSTRFGLVVTVGALLASVGASLAVLATVESWARPLAFFIALALLAVPTLAGHSLDAGRSWIDPLVVFVHAFAVAVWLGGLVALAIVLPRMRIFPELATAAAQRFSRFALLAVIVIAVSGLGSALAELSSVSQLWTTDYGKTLLVKTALFGVLLVLGWTSRHRLARGFAKVRASMSAEVAVLLGVLLAVGVLTSLPPGRTVRAQTPLTSPVASKLGISRLPAVDATVVGRQDGRLAAAVAVRPSGVAMATFIGTDAKAVDVGPVAIDGRPTKTCGIGCYIGRAGRDRIVVVAHGPTRLRFDLGLRLPADQLLSRINETYANQRSVAYTQHIATGLGSTVDALWKEVAPDSFSYRIRRGSEAIVIGKRRWDRDSGKNWKRSTTIKSSGFTPPWGGTGPFTNGHVLRQQAKTLTVSFLGADPSYPAWFTVVVNRRNLHVLRVQMTAASHFMLARYLSWNKPVKLEPPS